MTCCCFVWFIDLWPQGQMRLWCYIDLNTRSQSCAECRTLAWRRLEGWLLLETARCIEKLEFLRQICKTARIYIKIHTKNILRERDTKMDRERREREYKSKHQYWIDLKILVKCYDKILNQWAILEFQNFISGTRPWI